MIPSTKVQMMPKSPAISCLFLDIGEVLLTDGWDHHARPTGDETVSVGVGRDGGSGIISVFCRLMRMGRLSLEEYLGRVIFYRRRPFNHRARISAIYVCAIEGISRHD